MTTAAREYTACGRDGFIIVAVLWILIALATLSCHSWELRDCSVWKRKLYF